MIYLSTCYSSLCPGTPGWSVCRGGLEELTAELFPQGHPGEIRDGGEGEGEGGVAEAARRAAGGGGAAAEGGGGEAPGGDGEAGGVPEELGGQEGGGLTW